MFNSRLNKSGIKNGTEVNLTFSSNAIGNSNNETNFSHKLLLIDKQDSRLRKAFANNLSANIKLSKIQLFKIVQSEGFLLDLCAEAVDRGCAFSRIRNSKTEYTNIS